MRKIKIWDVLFWMFLVIGIVMVLWRVFGNSPTDLQVVAPFIAVIAGPQTGFIFETTVVSAA